MVEKVAILEYSTLICEKGMLQHCKYQAYERTTNSSDECGVLVSEFLHGIKIIYMDELLGLRSSEPMTPPLQGCPGS